MSDRPAIVVFPMAYANGPFHLGHLALLTQLTAKLKSYAHPASRLLLAYHLSGLPAKLFFDRYQSGDRQHIRIVKRLAKSAGITGELRCLEDWFALVRDANNAHLARLEFPIAVEHCHTTGPYNKAYDSFVQWLLAYCQSIGLIYKGVYDVLWCTRCRQVVGAHDLKGASEQVCMHERQLCTSGRLTTTGATAYPFESAGQWYWHEALKQYWCLTSLSLQSLRHKHPLTAATPILTDTTTSSKTLSFKSLTMAAMCRCGQYITIASEKQTFLNYQDSQWRALSLAKLQTIRMPEYLRRELREGIEAMRGWPLFRSRGYGTSCGSYFVDPLTDSVLFFYFSVISPWLNPAERYPDAFWAALFTDAICPPLYQPIVTEFRNFKENYDWIQGSGKDLTKNHLLFVVYFTSLFKLPLTQLFTIGHITVDGKKMSKSAGNTIDILEIPAPGYELRAVLLMVMEGLKDGDYSKKQRILQVNSLNKLIRLEQALVMPPLTVNQQLSVLVTRHLQTVINGVRTVVDRNQYSLALQKIIQVCNNVLIRTHGRSVASDRLMNSLLRAYFALINRADYAYQLKSYTDGVDQRILRAYQRLLQDLRRVKGGEIILVIPAHSPLRPWLVVDQLRRIVHRPDLMIECIRIQEDCPRIRFDRIK